MRTLFFIFICCVPSFAFAQITIHGYVTDVATAESLIGVSVFNAQKSIGTTSNNDGYYTLTIPESDSIYFQYLGYETKGFKVIKPTSLNVQLQVFENTLSEVKITSTLITQAAGTTQIDIKQLNTLPSMGGEKDLIKAVQLLPGIKKGADGTASMLARGGAADQNLIVLDDAPIYNPSHLLGFFSLFNTDAIKSATLQTGGFSAQYGGRLSSVLDIHTLNGNKEKTIVQTTFGLLASRASIQMPLFNKKGSLLTAGRISYVDKVFDLAGKNLPFFFYDWNTKLSYQINNRHQIMLSAYNGDDILNEQENKDNNAIKIHSKMGNSMASFRWTHAFKSQKQFGTFSLFTSSYRYKINAQIDDNALKIASSIVDVGTRYTIQHYFNNWITFTYGAEAIKHHFNPNKTDLVGSFNDFPTQASNKEVLLEMGAHASSTIKYKRFLLVSGIRLSAAHAQTSFYYYPEPRVKLDYQLNSKNNLFTSYSKMVQYMFLLSSSSAVLPTDIWYGVNDFIKPQQAHITSIGHQYAHQNITFKTELYYKPMQQLVEYKEGTIDFTNGNIDDKIIQGKGEAYGMEYSAKVLMGKWTFTTAYTLSWSTRSFKELNQGETYFSRYDRRHDFNINAYYEMNKRLAFSMLWCYASGSRFTAITSQFMMPNGNYSNIDFLPIYSKRNAIILNPAHRLDVNVIIKNKEGKRFKSEWHIGAYNVYNQTQPYRIKIINNTDGTSSYKQAGLFGFIPSISYQFIF